MSRMVITGGSGFIGTNLIEHFIPLAWEVINFDIAEPRNQNHLQYWKKVDVLNRNQLIEKAAEIKPEVFLHFAARTDLNEQADIRGYAANDEGTRNVIDAVRVTPTIERVIFASSQLVCKIGYSPKHEEDYLPSTLYGQSKVRMEQAIRSAELEVPWTIVRPTSLWGPWFDIPYKTFFLMIAKNYYVHPGKIETLKQWGFVGNSVFQVEKLIEAPVERVHKKTFYLADYEPISLRDFANKVQIALDAKPIRTVPVVALKSTALIGDGMQKLGWKNPPLTSFRFHNIVTNEVQDLEPLHEVVGPLPYTLDQGVDLTASWLRNNPVNYLL